MFGFLYKGIVNDDAVTLRNLVNRVMQEYASLSSAELKDAIARDFDDPYKLITDHEVFFTYAELPEFDIGFRRLRDDDDAHDISVIAKGKYTGFQLQAFGSGDVQCWAIGGATFRVTGPAKYLAKTMQQKYGIDDVSRDMKQLWHQ